MKVDFHLETGTDGSVKTSGQLASDSGTASFDFTFPDVADMIEEGCKKLEPLLDALKNAKPSA